MVTRGKEQIVVWLREFISEAHKGARPVRAPTPLRESVTSPVMPEGGQQPNTGRARTPQEQVANQQLIVPVHPSPN